MIGDIVILKRMKIRRGWDNLEECLNGAIAEYIKRDEKLREKT